VPVDCKTESLACPRSWKAGVPEISSDSSNAFDKMVATKFLYCHEGFTTCGYVPIDARNGNVLGHSGVTIGAGIDTRSLIREVEVFIDKVVLEASSIFW